jgi:FkbM family methyltransferase
VDAQDRANSGWASGPGQIKVNAVSLDEIFKDQKVDFLKIDIQGWEAEALFGAHQVLLEREKTGAP